eukprot:TRINITY_DN7923_c0_g1_i2.p1 TRINITY_DN7923_c0_g1~~TRINITY_DN7923_c0_g1_i2.p1  ORF type:complete len:942 (+),score=277.83 TRINITY_DN7923_c0_g1_i2:53-2827(+)
MAAPTAEEVVKRIQALYGPQTPKEERDACDKWLQDFRKEEVAWTVIDQLLTNSEDQSVLSFCATALTWRVKNAKPDQALSAQLQQCVLNHIVRLRQKAPKPILQQLSLTIVKLLVLHPNPSLVPELCNSLTQPETVDVLLLFLDTLGDEAGFILEELEEGAEATRADEPDINDEHPLLVSVRPNTRLVMDLIHNVWSGAQSVPSRISFVLKVYAKWLRFGSLQPEHVAASPITQASIQALGDLQHAEDACEVVTELAMLLADKTQNWTPVSTFLSSNILNIYNLLAPLGPDDSERADILTRVLARICRMFVRDMSVITVDTIAMVGIMVKAASYPDQRVFSHTLGFWHRLQVAVESLKDKNPAAFEAAIKGLSEPLSAIIPVLLKHTAFPAEADKWTEGDDDEDAFADFRRNDLSEAIEDCSQLLVPINAVLKAYPALVQNIGNPANWREVEAVLFFISCVPRSEPLENGLYPQLLANSVALSQQHWRVRAAYIEVIRIAGPWINEKGGEFMPALLDFTIACLAQPHVHKTAISTICSLCKTCTQHMVRLFPVLKDRAMLTGSLTLENAKKLMDGIGCLTCKLPESELNGAVEGLCSPILIRLQAASDPGVITIEVQKLMALFRGVDSGVQKESDSKMVAISQAWAKAFGVMWPALNSIIERAVQSEDLMEHLTGLLRYVMLACDTEFRAHLEPLIQTLVTAFNTKPHSCLLWLMGTVITVFGKEDVYVGPIMDVMNVLIGRTVKMLAEEPVGPNSDFIQEIFYLMTMGMNRFPTRLLASPLAAAVFDVALASIVNSDVKREAAFLTLKFFLDATDPRSQPDVRDAVRAFLQPRGAKLAEAMIVAVINRDLDTSDRVGDILLNIKELKEPQLQAWLHHALSALPQDIPPKAKQACLDSFNKATRKKEVHILLEKLHREAPSNWR